MLRDLIMGSVIGEVLQLSHSEAICLHANLVHLRYPMDLKSQIYTCYRLGLLMKLELDLVQARSNWKLSQVQAQVSSSFKLSRAETWITEMYLSNVAVCLKSSRLSGFLARLTRKRAELKHCFWARNQAWARTCLTLTCPFQLTILLPASPIRFMWSNI